MSAEILLVDDDPALRRAMRSRLEHWGHSVREAADGPAALAASESREFDLVFLDLNLPGMSGLDVLKTWREQGVGCDVVVLTAHGTVDAAVEALRRGAVDFLQKPADFDLVESVLRRVLERRSLVRTNTALLEVAAAEPPASASPAMVSLLAMASKAAASAATVLITGESGSGKQVLAEWIHRRGPRASGPFVYVNLGALEDELAESALFGHEKGAFTGAHQRRAGKVELASGGSLFLDEIGDVTPRLQVKLLHFLDTGEFERLGGTRTIRGDARVLAATNRDLASALREGTFREDLYHRLNVVALRVPPLRERPEDILVLADLYREGFGQAVGRHALRFSDETRGALRAYAWPGNVRQLRNVVERMVVLAAGDILTPDLLPPELAAPAPAERGLEGLGLHEAELEFRIRHIRDALRRAGGNKTEAARLLGVQRSYLSRVIRELGIEAGGDGNDGMK
ncbi:MAG TPA: sigma-54 dependent transcriptional regulator [Acidobacteriota bacterium]|nr:sigma-54 dependent transcriptional regulator [Acidobacteriota bacterium]